MKIALLCNHWAAIPSLLSLQEKGILEWIGLPEKENIFHPQLRLLAGKEKIPVFTIPEDMSSSGELFKKAETVFVQTFPYKIPEEIFNLPPGGFLNFHYGLLPEYRGIEPIFWQIANREDEGGITVHKITNEFDKGDMAYIHPLAITPVDTYGTHLSKLALAGQQCTQAIVEKLQTGKEIIWQPQDRSRGKSWKRPKEETLVVNWAGMDGPEINALVRAANPVYGGAFIFIRQMPFRLHQVTEASGDIPDNITPGTIINTSQGLFVAVKNKQALRLDIIQGNDGFFSGELLITTYGLKTGDRFEEPPRGTAPGR